jgi:hypothetical protein
MYHKTINLFGSSYFETVQSDVVDLLNATGFSAHFVYDDTTPAAATFTAAVTDICTIVTHGYTTGLKVRVTSGTTLPAGLVAGTDYYVIYLTANTFKLSDTYAHALAGTDVINITDTGTGVHTMTPSVIAGASIKLQCSNDDTNWDDIASQTENITVDGNAVFNQSGVFYRYIRGVLTITSGRLGLTGVVITKNS